MDQILFPAVTGGTDNSPADRFRLEARRRRGDGRRQRRPGVKPAEGNIGYEIARVVTRDLFDRQEDERIIAVTRASRVDIGRTALCRQKKNNGQDRSRYEGERPREQQSGFVAAAH